MFTAAVDCTDHRRNGHAALTGDFLKTAPELVFEADALLWPAMTIERFKTGDMASSPNMSPSDNMMSKRHYVDGAAFRTRKTPGRGATGGYQSGAAAV
jgi:hypothetical protein